MEASRRPPFIEIEARLRKILGVINQTIGDDEQVKEKCLHDEIEDEGDGVAEVRNSDVITDVNNRQCHKQDEDGKSCSPRRKNGLHQMAGELSNLNMCNSREDTLTANTKDTVKDSKTLNEDSDVKGQMPYASMTRMFCVLVVVLLLSSKFFSLSIAIGLSLVIVIGGHLIWVNMDQIIQSFGRIQQSIDNILNSFLIHDKLVANDEKQKKGTIGEENSNQLNFNRGQNSEGQQLETLNFAQPKRRIHKRPSLIRATSLNIQESIEEEDF